VAGKKLKVFQAQFGFYDTVVAASSQAAALRAWGVNQNLFASGEAKVTNDEAAVSAAIAHPEILLRRAVGSSDPFTLEPASLPTVPDAPKKAVVKPAALAKLSASARSPADRTKLNAAEKALGELDEDRKREEAAHRRQAEGLESRRISAQSAYVDARKEATTKVLEARAAYRQAGGAD
jgi:hypothetical protein